MANEDPLSLAMRAASIPGVTPSGYVPYPPPNDPLPDGYFSRRYGIPTTPPPLYRELEAALFAASWERMVLLACSLSYSEPHEAPMPRAGKDHDLETLGVVIECLRRYFPWLEPDGPE